MFSDSSYMHRCLQLARLGAGHVAPNPLVGAVLVHGERIIGEGFHQQYGKPHAEVNCINAVSTDDLSLIPSSTLYVSLEPCSHYGKTPPCVDLIIEKKIRKVVIGVVDPFPEVKGRGIEKLRQAGVEVVTDVLKNECIELNKRFFVYQLHHRPYIILKWAQSANAQMARSDRTRFNISNEYSRRLVHKWRSEEDAILVGTNTAFFDDPELSNRYWHGSNPLRLVVDMDLRLPSSLKLFDGRISTIVFNSHKHTLETGSLPVRNVTVGYYRVTTDVSLLHQVVHALYQLKVQSVLVEGGARLLQSFIDEDMWDEIRLITNRELRLQEGIPSPQFQGIKTNEQELFSDSVEVFRRGMRSSE